ncbi:unnamed protein product [Linum trigynum]|uniref:Secreted protein n=1 Tax=Linum trigynum TaxID=586398 RepID=A0AAV2FHC8_9ROSI
MLNLCILVQLPCLLCLILRLILPAPNKSHQVRFHALVPNVNSLLELKHFLFHLFCSIFADDILTSPFEGTRCPDQTTSSVVATIGVDLASPPTTSPPPPLALWQ